jgi:hypothetical protein
LFSRVALAAPAGWQNNQAAFSTWSDGFQIRQNFPGLRSEFFYLRLVFFHPAENLTQRLVAFVNGGPDPVRLAAGQFDVQGFLHDKQCITQPAVLGKS